MQVALSELKINVGKYVNLAQTQDILVTRNGRLVAKIVGTEDSKVEDMKSLFGITKLPKEYNDPNYDPDYELLREQRIEL